jgi:hypothetical protein
LRQLFLDVAHCFIRSPLPSRARQQAYVP